MRCIAAIRRAQFVALAVVEDGRIEYIRRVNLLGLIDSADAKRIRDVAQELATSFDATTLVVEPNSWLYDELCRLRCTVRLLSLSRAKRRLLSAENPTHSQLYDHMVDKHPKLRRFVHILPAGNPRVATSNRWRTLPLLAAALGLAAGHATH